MIFISHCRPTAQSQIDTNSLARPLGAASRQGCISWVTELCLVQAPPLVLEVLPLLAEPPIPGQDGVQRKYCAEHMPGWQENWMKGKVLLPPPGISLGVGNRRRQAHAI